MTTELILIPVKRHLSIHHLHSSRTGVFRKKTFKYRKVEQKRKTLLHRTNCSDLKRLNGFLVSLSLKNSFKAEQNSCIHFRVYETFVELI